MIPIFNNIEVKNLEDFFADLMPEDIEEICLPVIFKRGIEYFESELVSGVEFNLEKTKLSANVRGNSIYDIRINLKNSVVSGSCSCPYDDGECKHIIAVMLYCIEHHEEIDIATNQISETKVQQYLDSLTKEKLIELVLEYAPEEFFITLKNKSAKPAEAKKVFMKV